MEFGKTTIKTVLNDITKVDFVEASVSAANKSLLGGGGVDGAIHRALEKVCWRSAVPFMAAKRERQRFPAL